MSVASSIIAADDADSRSDRLGRGSAIVLATYLAVMTMPVWRHVASTSSIAPLVVHLAILGYTLGLLAMPVSLRRAAMDWLTLTIGPFMYVELRWIIAGLGMPHRDAVVAGWERALFPSNPSAVLAPRVDGAMVSEILHLAYASYYLLIYVPPLALYRRGQRDAFVTT